MLSWLRTFSWVRHSCLAFCCFYGHLAFVGSLGAQVGPNAAAGRANEQGDCAPAIELRLGKSEERISVLEREVANLREGIPRAVFADFVRAEAAARYSEEVQAGVHPNPVIPTAEETSMRRAPTRQERRTPMPNRAPARGATASPSAPAPTAEATEIGNIGDQRAPRGPSQRIHYMVNDGAAGRIVDAIKRWDESIEIQQHGDEIVISGSAAVHDLIRSLIVLSEKESPKK